MTKLKDPDLREWYIRACVENGWSRAALKAGQAWIFGSRAVVRIGEIVEYQLPN